LERTQGSNPLRQQRARQTLTDVPPPTAGEEGGGEICLTRRAGRDWLNPLRPLRTADLHIESELSGPMPHFSGAVV
jgi:hypothetical protein